MHVRRAAVRRLEGISCTPCQVPLSLEVGLLVAVVAPEHSYPALRPWFGWQSAALCGACLVDSGHPGPSLCKLGQCLASRAGNAMQMQNAGA
jgi:hypothetical protein